MEVAGVPVVTAAYPRTVRLVSTARLRPPVLTPLVDTPDELRALAEIEGATSARLMAQSVGISGLAPNELVYDVPHAAFINTAHSDIRMATVNSRAWGEAPDTAARQSTQKGLYWSQIEPDVCWSHPGANQHEAAPR